MPITKKQELKNVDISKLVPYPNNPRKNDDAVDKVAKSLTEYGLVKNSIVVDEDMVLITGHTTTKAMQALGWTKAPEVTQVFGLTAAQKQAYRIADNRLGELADWDTELLGRELEELRDADFDIGLTGFDDIQLDELFPPEMKEVEEDDFEPPAEVKTDIKRGDIIQLGRHRLMCGDSTSAEDVGRLMDGKKADLLLTDPPYNVGYVGKTKDALTIDNDSADDTTFHTFLVKAFTQMVENLKEGGSYYIWHADSEGFNFRGAVREVGLQVRECLIWVKNSLVLGRQDYQWMHEPCLYGWKDGKSHRWYSDRAQTTVLQFDRPTVSKEHPTMKPIKLFAYLIENSSIKDDIVMDIFCGSGTTLIACEQLNRICYGMEISPQYCQVIVDRWETYTGQKAECVNE